jgi:hypothetical protein
MSNQSMSNQSMSNQSMINQSGKSQSGNNQRSNQTSDIRRQSWVISKKSIDGSVLSLWWERDSVYNLITV